MIIVQGKSPAVPLLVVDVDSTIRHGFDELGRFVNGPGDVVVFPEATEMMRRWRAGGGRIVAVSNQGGIALGHTTNELVSAAMMETYRQAEGLLDKMCWCWHHPDSPNPDLTSCWCRKPSPGLIFEAISDLGQFYGERYPPSLALMVGDRPEDAECARRAGIDFQWAVEWRAQAQIGAAQ